MRFDIQPYTGATPIAFGMTREQVHRLLGAPESSNRIWDESGTSEHYHAAGYTLGYSNAGLLNHLGIAHGKAELSILGRPIWTKENQPDPNPLLLALDPKPLEWVGFWIFLEIGVTTSGYHDDDPSEQGITVFVRGAHSATDLADAKTADTSKYRSA